MGGDATMLQAFNFSDAYRFMPANLPNRDPANPERRRLLIKIIKIIGISALIGLAFKFLFARFLASTRFRPKRPQQ
uniref:Uncharacterized protein n=1 Tax=Magnetococcus massalia (strain MO-1) TaxID=451514 RepID=A0A1S7LCT9_MAGMO|nr:Protein of unknown function [Candidatus Magnetococcus massalia]